MINQVKRNPHKFLFSLFVTISLILVLSFNINDRPEVQVAALATEKASVEALTDQIIKEGKISRSEVVNGRRKLSGKGKDADLIKKAKDRKAKMLKLAKENPREFVLNAYPKKVSDELDSTVKPYLEKEVELEGEYRDYHFDYFKDNKSEEIKKIKVGDDEFELNFSGEVDEIKSGDRIKVRGYKLDNQLILFSGQEGGLTIQGISDQISTGEQKTLVILHNSINNRTEPISTEEVEDVMFNDENSVAEYHKENSYSQTTITGDIAGYYTLSAPDGENCSLDPVAREAKAAAVADGFDVESYDRYIFVGNMNCSFAGAAVVGGDLAWIRSFTGGFRSVANHEYGHMLGAQHASLKTCSTGVLQSPYNETACTHSEYGDRSDVMGAAAQGHFNAGFKDMVGWLSTSQKTTITSSGIYDIAPVSTASGLKLLRIAIPGRGLFYELDYRQPIGFDYYQPQEYFLSEFYTGAALRMKRDTGSGIFHHGNNENSNTYLLDVDIPNEVYYVLKDNFTYTDSVHGVTIKQLSHSSSYAKVQVTIDNSVCRRRAPNLSLSPISQVGGIGQSKDYVLTITNSDSSACASTNFNLIDEDEYSGKTWSISNSVGSVSLNPGDSISVTKTVAPANNSEIGHYILGAGVDSNSSSSHEAAFNYSYILNGVIGDIGTTPNTVSGNISADPVDTTLVTAQALDLEGEPIVTGVTYNWSVESEGSTSIGNISNNSGSSTTFTPTATGYGRLVVKATYNGDLFTKEISVGNTTAVPSVTPTNTPTPSPTPIIQTLTLYPVADAYVRQNAATTNFGTEDKLSSRETDPKVLIYIRYNLSTLAGKNIVSAKMRVKVKDSDDGARQLKRATTESWSETGITYNNRPSFETNLSSQYWPTVNEWVEYTTTGVVNLRKGGPMTLGIASGGDVGFASLYSREAATANRPRLIVEYTD